MRSGKKRVELGQHIVADPEICHGQPTFMGTRIMVWQVLDDVADGRSWDFTCNVRWGGRVPLAGVAEAVRLAKAAWLQRRKRPTRRSERKAPELAAACRYIITHNLRDFRGSEKWGVTAIAPSGFLRLIERVL